MDYDATIRGETPADRDAIRALNRAAFERSAEADLVDALRESARPFVSLVSDQEGAIVGHVAFSPVTIEGAEPGPSGASPAAMGLGPMAVQYEWRRRGIGSALVLRGLEVCRGMGAELVVVLGDPAFYGRLGFEPASRLGLRCEFDAPAEAFLALAPDPGRLEGRSGLVRYHGAFRAVS